VLSGQKKTILRQNPSLTFEDDAADPHGRPQENTAVSTFFYLLSNFYGANRPSVFGPSLWTSNKWKINLNISEYFHSSM